MTTLSRRRAFFLSTCALTALLLALPGVPASATTPTSGIDTPATVSDLPLSVEGVEIMDLKAGGFVGIGTTTPATMLQVMGTVTDTGEAVTGNATISGMVGIGIGMTNPAEPGPVTAKLCEMAKLG